MSATVPTPLKAHYPGTNEYGPAIPTASVADAEAAVTNAVIASRDLRLADRERRARVLRDLAERLRGRGEAIVDLAASETGLPAEPRLRSELERTCVQLELHADVCASGQHLEPIIDHADPDARPAPRPDLRRINVPVGPVVIFGASNFPLAFSTAGGDTASALAAGCPVIVKGHRLHPGTGVLVAEQVEAAVREGGLPSGTFAHLLTTGHDVADALVEHPDTAAIAFTGSQAGGRALMDRAAARTHPIPVFAEMGSLNPVVVTRRALETRGEKLADLLTQSVCSVGGQLCTKPGVVLVPDPSFSTALESRFARRDVEVLLSADMASAFATSTGAELTDQTRVRPTVIACTVDELIREPQLREEHFGPGVVVASYSSPEELTAALAIIGGTLTATLHADPEELDTLQPLIDQLTGLAGRVLFDGVPTGVSVTWAMTHGGPYPATSNASHTSVGQTSMWRFLRPVTFQSAPGRALPPELRDGNPLGLIRRVDGVLTRD